jgi:hypothetical protein
MMKRIGMTLWAALAGAPAITAPALAADAEPPPAAIEAALQEADRRFVAGDLAGALAILEPACSKSERPECLFSLGAVQHGLGHCPEALAYYLRYREVAPGGKQIEEVTAALQEVEERCGAAPRAAASSSAVAIGEAAPTAEGPKSAAAAAPEPGAPAPSAPTTRSTLTSQLMLGSFVLSGTAAVSSAVFGVLAVQAARDCERARRYDESFRDVCEEDGPRYQGLWQGFALASASFLGIGMTLWWIDQSSTATFGVSGAGTPTLHYRREF